MMIVRTGCEVTECESVSSRRDPGASMSPTSIVGRAVTVFLFLMVVRGGFSPKSPKVSPPTLCLGGEVTAKRSEIRQLCPMSRSSLRLSVLGLVSSVIGERCWVPRAQFSVKNGDNEEWRCRSVNVGFGIWYLVVGTW